MKFQRCLFYIGMAIAMCIGSFSAQAGERISYLCAQSVRAVGFQADTMARHNLTVAQWRTKRQPSNERAASNLIALSNHFGLASAAPFSVPDWDGHAAV